MRIITNRNDTVMINMLNSQTASPAGAAPTKTQSSGSASALSRVQRSLSRKPVKALALILSLATILGLTSLVTRPTPAEAAQASQIIVRAAGKSGAEQMALRINGEEVSRWTVSQGKSDYVFNAGQTIQVDELEVAFINDRGATNDLTVDYVDVGGIVLQSESPSTISTGTFVPGEGCVSRPSISEGLHCAGSFTYAVSGSTEVLNAPTPTSADLSVRVFGATGTEQVDVRINGSTVISQTLAQGWQELNHDLGGTTINAAEVRFNNDNGPRDVRVDYLEVDGQRFESESPTTRASGTYTGRCNTDGPSDSEWLRCNGAFRYDVNNTAAVITAAPQAAATETQAAPAPEQAPAPEAAPTPTTVAPTTTTAAPAPQPAQNRSFSSSNGARWSISQVISGTIAAGDGSNPNEEAPAGRHDAPLNLNQGWNWAQGPTRNSVWGQLGTGGSQFAEWRCAVIPELGHTPPVPFRVNVREGAYYQFVNSNWQLGFNVDLTGGNHGGYLGTAGVTAGNPFNSGGHGQIQWRREADGSFSAPWNPSALMMHFWAAQRQAPAPGQTAEFLTSELRLQQPDGQTVDLNRVRVLFQCGADYYAVRGGQGTQVPGPGIGTYTRATSDWKPSLWVTLPRNTPANTVGDFQTWLSNNTPPNVG